MSDSLIAIDPTFKCEKCGNNMVKAGTKECYLCKVGAGINVEQILAGYSNKVKTVKATQMDIMASQKPSDPMPKF